MYLFWLKPVQRTSLLQKNPKKAFNTITRTTFFSEEAIKDAIKIFIWIKILMSYKNAIKISHLKSRSLHLYSRKSCNDNYILLCLYKIFLMTISFPYIVIQMLYKKNFFIVVLWTLHLRLWQQNFYLWVGNWKQSWQDSNP